MIYCFVFMLSLSDTVGEGIVF